MLVLTLSVFPLTVISSISLRYLQSAGFTIRSPPHGSLFRPASAPVFSHSSLDSPDSSASSSAPLAPVFPYLQPQKTVTAALGIRLPIPIQFLLPNKSVLSSLAFGSVLSHHNKKAF